MSKFEFDADDPLARVSRESESANQALNDYARMGPRRSLEKLLAQYVEVGKKRSQASNEAGTEGAEIPPIPPTQRKATLGTWSVRYRWLDRVEAWGAIEKQKDDALWEERRRALKEQDWTQGDLLRERAQGFLAQLPRFMRSSTETVARDDGVIIQIVTIGLNTNLREIADVLKTASGLQRLAAEEPTDRVQYSGALLDQLIARELAELTDSGQAGDADPAAGDEPGEADGGDE